MSAVQMVPSLKDLLVASEPPMAIPPCPDLVTKLRRVVARPPVNPRQVVYLIGSQPGLGSQLVATVNDPRYGLRMKHNSVMQVITAMGLPHTIAMTTALCLSPALSDAGHRPVEPAMDRARQLAFASAFIAGHCPAVSRELAFVHGMLRGAGSVVRFDGFVDYPAPADNANPPWDPDQDEIGARLGESWGLPQVVVEAIRRRQDFMEPGAMRPTTIAAGTLTAVSLLAEYALNCCAQPARGSSAGQPDRAVRDHLSLDEQRFEDIVLEVQAVFA